jgi:hypothetical protein
MQALEWLGKGAGVLSAPITGGVAWLRRARMFHPRGLVHRVDVRLDTKVADDLRQAATRLAGTGFIRLSSAWWKTGEKPDLLGVGIRIGDDQDLLFATARSLVTLLPATLTTDVHDFLANDYFAMAPFELEGVGRVKMMLKSRGKSPEGPNREQRLLAALEAGQAGFELMVSRGGDYEPFVHVWIGEALELDEEKIRLTPENAGRGLRPVGFVNAARRIAYDASASLRRIASARSAH